MKSRNSWRPGRLLGYAAVVAAVVASLWWFWAPEPTGPSISAPHGTGADSLTSGSSPDPGSAGNENTLTTGPAAAASRQVQLNLWQQRYDRAAQVYASYRDATRYPPHSRPLVEHPDQMQPFAPIIEVSPLRDAKGQPAGDLLIRTMQDRVFLAGAESTGLYLEARDRSGRVVPMSVRASVQRLSDARPGPSVRSALAFSDDGSGADQAAGDGRHSALLAPAVQGFAGQAGTLRVVAEVSAGGVEGTAAFDVVYEPQSPGAWTGVREAMEDGNLVFYLRARLNVGGRYVASARVFDSRGEAVALLTFNDELPRGNAEFRLSLAGVLVQDMRPAFPLRLTDVEGFLLKPDTFPDRAMMPRQEGGVHVSRSYPVDAFSTNEWQSEERERHLAEFGRDVERARQAVDRLRPR